jgi:virginiamycin A acetyltransferase
VWFGTGSVIMPGVSIGDGAIIGAYSIVTKNVEPYTIVAGNAAHLIRKRFIEDVIEKLLQVKWWDWEYDKITRNIKAIVGTDIKQLAAAV